MKYLFTLFLLCSALIADEIQLKYQLNTAAAGNYVVTEQGKTYAFLYVREKNSSQIIIEEVAIPASNFTRQNIGWKQWFESGAAGHTLWTISQINLDTGSFEETFSYTHQGWVDMSESNSFLSTLLNLRFSEVPEQDRKRVGLPPGSNRQDNRPIWNPRVIVEGCALANVPFMAFRTIWPKDHTELSCKPIDVYLPYTIEGANYPSFFPYLVEVEGKVGNAKLRVVDSGLDAHSPKQPLPYKAPELTSDPFWSDDGLLFEIKTNSAICDYLITAEQTDSSFALPLPFPSITCENGRILVQNEQLTQWLTHGERYRFQIYPKEHPELCIETEPVLI